tara:strand:- start:1060 stop:1770 length:711 start_codon:yes stop_codon:yes gene_type:complete
MAKPISLINQGISRGISFGGGRGISWGGGGISFPPISVTWPPPPPPPPSIGDLGGGILDTLNDAKEGIEEGLEDVYEDNDDTIQDIAGDIGDIGDTLGGIGGKIEEGITGIAGEFGEQSLKGINKIINKNQGNSLISSPANWWDDAVGKRNLLGDDMARGMLFGSDQYAGLYDIIAKGSADQPREDESPQDNLLAMSLEGDPLGKLGARRRDLLPQNTFATPTRGKAKTLITGQIG